MEINSNNTFIDLNAMNANKALFEHDQLTANSQKKPVNGTNDKFGDVRIRLAKIDNYLIDRGGSKIDPLKVDNVINMSTGKVVITYLEMNGGVIRPNNYGYPSEGYTEPWSYIPDNDSSYPEDRTLDCYNHDKASDKEIIELTHAFIWCNGSNWCGMNYIPPVGSIVIVGFKKNNAPVILGYAQTSYKDCKPYLKPGETMIKGYGDNYIHWRWSNKLDIHVKSKKGEKDLDDPYNSDGSAKSKQPYASSIDMWGRFDAYTENIIFYVHNLDDGSRTTLEIKPKTLNVTSGTTHFSISPNDIIANVGNGSKLINISGTNVTVKSGDSTVTVNDNNVKLNSSNVIIDGDSLNINSKQVNFNSANVNIKSDDFNVNSNNVTMDSSNFALNGSVIKLEASNLNLSGSSSTMLGSGGTIVLSAGGNVNMKAANYNLD